MPTPDPAPARAPRPLTPPVIGLTGGIAAGKSTVSAHLREQGAHIIDADRVGHAVIAPDGEAYAGVVAAFGQEIVAADGRIDRTRLGPIVFSDPAKLERLNALTHPPMAARVAAEIAGLRGRPIGERPPLIIVDAAILLEAGWDALCDAVWVVLTEPARAIARLKARNGMSEEQAQARLRAQWDNAERAARASRVLHNDGTVPELLAQVEAAWRDTVG